MMLSNYRLQLVFIIPLLVCMSCKKEQRIPENDQAEYSAANISVLVKTNNLSVIWDSLSNMNAAGNIYSIHKINFYISDIELKRNDGFIYKSSRVFYIDPEINTKSVLRLDSIPKGNYTKMTFLIGVDSSRNVDYGLESTVDNLNMAWPTAMGGGYHFLKIEGHYMDTANISRGFAVHLGKNVNLVNATLYQSLSQQNTSHDYSLTFNVNEVFMTPYLYNLNIDKNYTMSDSVAMSKIKYNLQDAFSIMQNN